MATTIHPNSKNNSTLFLQPVDSVIQVQHLNLLKTIEDCAHTTEKKAVDQCVEERMNRVANELLEWSKSIKPLSTSVIISDQSQRNPQHISQNTYKILLERATFEARNQNYETMVQRVKEAVVFGRMGNVGEEKIRRDILEILKLTPLVESARPLQVPSKEGKKVAVIPESDKIIQGTSMEDHGILRHLSFFGGPFLSYEISKKRSSLGLGAYGEILLPLEEQSHWMVGAEMQLTAKVVYDQSVFFQGELKSIDGVSVFPLLEFGYRESDYTLLCQAGAWFAYSKLFNSVQEKDPNYSDNPFENLQLRLGIKSYFLDNRVRIAGGYQYTPVDNGVYFEMGYRFGG